MAPTGSTRASVNDLMQDDSSDQASLQIYLTDADLARDFGVTLPEGPAVLTDMSGDDLRQVLRATDQQLRDSDKIPCAGCGRADLLRSQQMHIAPLVPGTFFFERIACYDCLMCKGPGGNEPWLWALPRWFWRARTECGPSSVPSDPSDDL